MTAPVSRVGAPLIEAFAPPIDSAEGSFHLWLNANRSRVHGWLDLITRRWKPLGSFVELNYVHPRLGPSGAVVMTSQEVDLRTVRHRVTRLTVIPHSEVAPFVPRWRRGEAVLVAVADMPERLALRYANTPVEWSLNVPIFVRRTWVGLVGAVATARGLAPAVGSYQALADLMMRDFAARDAWRDFRATLDDNRFPQGLRRETDDTSDRNRRPPGAATTLDLDNHPTTQGRRMHAAAETGDEGDAVYNIGTAARKSGLSVTTIRTWEDRYGAVVPVRDASGRRLYSNEQIAQLAWLRQQIDAGLRASEAHRLLISGDIDEPASPALVDHGSAWVTFLAWTEGEEPWIASVLADLGRGLRSGATALAAVVDNPICGPVLTVTTVDPGAREPIDDLAVLVMDRVEGLVEEVTGGDSFAADGSAFGVDGAGVVVTPIRLGGELAGVLVATGAAVDDPTVLMQRAARVIESRIEADRARSAFSSLLD